MNPGYLLGWLSGFFDELRTNVDSDHAARRFLAALELDRYAIVQLSEPQEREDDELATWWDRVGELRVSVHDNYPSEVGLSYDFQPYEPLSPAEARTLAGALLAAASAAEAVTP